MIRIIFAVAVLFGTAFSAASQYRRNLDKELDRLDTDIALILSRSLDYMPIWSDSSDAVYVNILDYWYTFNITQTSLVESEIRGKKGAWNQNELLEPIDDAIVANFELDDYMENARIAEQGNVKATIEQQGFSSILIIEVDGKEFYRQQSGGEVYLFPAISPDGKYLVFISEMNGLMLVRLPHKTAKMSKLDKILNKGIRSMNKNDCEYSMKHFKEALEIDSTNVTALHNLALCQFNLNLLEELAITLSKGLRHDPGNFESQELLASLHYLNGEYEEAAEICEVIMDAQPYYYENYYLLLAVYEAMEELKPICRTLEKAQAARLGDPELKAYYLSSCN